MYDKPQKWASATTRPFYSVHSLLDWFINESIHWQWKLCFSLCACLCGRFWQIGSPLSSYFKYASIVTDVNECLTNKGGCSHQCVNMAGTYRCECPSGYTLHSNKQDCVNGEHIHFDCHMYRIVQEFEGEKLWWMRSS